MLTWLQSFRHRSTVFCWIIPHLVDGVIDGVLVANFQILIIIKVHSSRLRRLTVSNKTLQSTLFGLAHEPETSEVAHTADTLRPLAVWALLNAVVVGAADTEHMRTEQDRSVDDLSAAHRAGKSDNLLHVLSRENRLSQVDVTC